MQTEHECSDMTKFYNGTCVHCIWDTLAKGKNKREIQYRDKMYYITKPCYCYYDVIYNRRRIRIISNPRVIEFRNSNSDIRKVQIFTEEEFKVQIKTFILPFYINNSQRNHFTTENDYSLFFVSSISVVEDLQFNITEKEFKKLLQKTDKPFFITTNDLSDISYNYFYYFDKVDMPLKYNQTKEREDLLLELNNFIQSDNENFFYMTGPIGIGKTVTLLLFQRNDYSHSTIYFNLKCLDNLFNQIKSNPEKDPNKIDPFFEVIFNEILTISETYEQFKKFCMAILKQLNSMLDYLEHIVEYLIRNKGNTIVIIDQYTNYYDKNNDFLNKLRNNLNNTKIKVIIASSVNNTDICAQVQNSLLYGDNKSAYPYKYYSKLIDNTEIIKLDISQSEYSDLVEKFNYLPYVCYPLLEMSISEAKKFTIAQEKDIGDNIIKYYGSSSYEICKKISILQNAINKYLTKEEISSICKILPLKYIVINSHKEAEIYTLSYHFSLIEKVLSQIKKGAIADMQNNPLTEEEIKLLNEEMFQDIIIYSLTHYKKNNIPLMLHEEKVDSLITLKSKEKESYNGYITKNLYGNIAFTQINRKSPYDLAVFLKEKEKYYYILFQIALNKETSLILQRQEIENDCRIIQQKIKEKYNIELPDSAFYYHYIFCKESQDKIITNESLSILFYSMTTWSFDNFDITSPEAQVFQSNDEKHIAFDLEDSYKKLKEIINECINFNPFLGVKHLRDAEAFNKVDNDTKINLRRYVAEYSGKDIEKVQYIRYINPIGLGSYILPSRGNSILICQLKNKSYVIRNEEKGEYYICDKKKVIYDDSAKNESTEAIALNEVKVINCYKLFINENTK